MSQPANAKALVDWVTAGIMRHMEDMGDEDTTVQIPKRMLRQLVRDTSQRTIQAITAWLQDLDIDAALEAKRASEEKGISA